MSDIRLGRGGHWPLGLHHAPSGLYAGKLPTREPTLREALLGALEASETLSAYYALPMPEEPVCEELEERRHDAEQALYAAFARCGIDKALANKIGRVIA